MEQPRYKVYVHLGRGYDARDWYMRIQNGTLLGINEDSPYGYAKGSQRGLEVEFSVDHPEGFFIRALRLFFRALLGFDLVHAIRNYVSFQRSDVVWTHTETQYLALCLLRKVSRRRFGRAKIIAQTIWLADKWPGYWWPRKYFIKWLMKEVSVITVHSPDNQAILRRIFPAQTVCLIKFGIRTDVPIEISHRKSVDPIKVLSLGNDVHRDWDTLVDAVKGESEIHLTVISRNFPKNLSRECSNIKVLRPKQNKELLAAYSQSDLVVVPLRDNAHASGLTVIQEATMMSKPVICSKVGGLDHYFDDTMVSYVPPGDPVALRLAIRKSGSNYNQALSNAYRARQAMEQSGINSTSYIEAHVELSVGLMRAAQAKIS